MKGSIRMTKDVIISIKGLQTENREEGPIEVISPGKYHYVDGKHEVYYEEIDEEETGEKGIVKNIVRIGPHTVEVLKTGMNNSHMIFVENEKNITYYHTPFGEIMVGLDTTDFKLVEEENAIGVKLKYDLEMNQNFVSECSITIKILSKE